MESLKVIRELQIQKKHAGKNNSIPRNIAYGKNKVEKKHIFGSCRIIELYSNERGGK